MGILGRLLAGGTKDDGEGALSRLQATTREQTRRGLVATAVRDTLGRHGLAPGCITAEALPGTTAASQRGLHIQLVFRDWQPSLSSYVVSLESAVKSSLRRLDPLSPSWVTGMSWRFEPKNRALWPRLPAAAPSREGIGAVPLGTLLRSRDEAFMAAAPGVSAADFRPTQPMES